MAAFDSAAFDIAAFSDLAFDFDSGGGSDTTPDQFTFTDQSGVALSTVTTSAAVTITGIDAASAISVSGDASGLYDINGSGSFVATPGTVNNGDTVRARGTSSGSYLTTVNVTITVGGVSDTFSITTRTEPAAGGGSINAPVRLGGMMIFG